MAYRLGIDIGGTFTDALLLDEASGATRIAKVPSTPADPSLGFLEAARRILAEAGVAPAELRLVVHGTTVATNTIIEGKGAPAGLLTTAGFRDMLEIARQTRPALYDLRFTKPPPLVPRHRCHGIPERLDHRGAVVAPLDEEAVRAAGAALRAEGVAAVAVCFLHSYVNGAHERRARELLREVFPEAQVALSSEVAPEFREYLRASTTVINATVQPVAARYLRSIEARLREAGVRAELLVMQSSGGVFSFASGCERPVFLIESGPAAGVIAAAHVGAGIGQGDLIAFDMGGTTAKASLVLDGQPGVTKEFEVGAVAMPGGGRARGGGYPIRTPVIDLVEIGAGGGSLAWVDDGGVLRVGPRSAGADPGPACYGRGGAEPTVTDANLVLGRLSADNFLGGAIALDAGAARAAVARVAGPLGMEVVAAAHAIVEIANTAMVGALRLVTVQRGHDPRELAMVAFGGAGPLHAGRLAAEIGCPALVVPPSPGTTSALGLLATDLRHDYAATLLCRLDAADPAAVSAAFTRMEAEGLTTLAGEGVPADAARCLRQLDLRYVGQSHELTLAVPDDVDELGAAAAARLAARFHAEHARAYGTSAPGEPVELVSLRVSAVGQIARPRPRALAEGGPGPKPALRERRPVFFAEAGGYQECPIYDRYRLLAGMRLAGPAVVEELDSTTVIHPGQLAEVDAQGALRIRLAVAGARP
ncbi:MAG TPA: hydantoinase/oxoprolinase family protein [Chloroflexaceae bacterium]|nr:hydantoinase/oxoprolinase family protein [Chloroflexaceae bacterium]